ncbi:hypothetical protein [Sanyastnella coralliicola]|uniref:hypothetical protein n=1 Tax=Sanyastnella coralliicola TaxID=3069118 RepID=UPI0027B8B996|nr:hypothetical protein [Longitalea sp. SCSIO 12813]
MRHLLLCILLGFGLSAFAQPCGNYYTDVYCVDIRWNEQADIKVKKVSLVDVMGEPLYHQDHYSVGRRPQLVEGKEMVFIENTKKERTKHDWPRVDFDALEVLGDYICPLQKPPRSEMKHLFFDKPVYVIRVDYEWNNESRIAYHSIQADRKINLCSNHLTGDYLVQRDHIAFYDGSLFTPEEIWLPNEYKDDDFRSLRIRVDSVLEDKGQMIIIKGVDYGNWFTGEMRTLDFEAEIKFHAARYNDYVVLDIFEQPNPIHPDLRIFVRDEPVYDGLRRKKYIHLRYNSAKDRYEVFPDLCTVGNEWFDENTKLWKRTLFRDSEKEITITTQQYQDRTWVTTNESTRQKPQPFTTDYRCVQWLDGQVHVLPVQFTNGNAGYFHALDTFIYANTCTEELYWKEPKPQPMSYDLVCPARGTQAIAFNDSAWLNPMGLYHEEQYLNLPLGEGAVHQLRVDYFITDPKNEVVNEDGNRAFRIPRGEHRVLELETTEDGQPVGYGLRSTVTGDKYGTWKRWKGNQRLADTITIKELSIHIPNIGLSKITEVVIDGLQVKYLHEGQNLTVYLKKGDRHIEIRTEDGAGYYDINYDFLPAQSSVYLFLLEDGDDYHTAYGVRYPVKWTERFVIHWNILPNMRFHPSEAIEEIKAAYPQLSFFEFGSYMGYYQFEVNASADYEWILEELLEYDQIKGLARVAELYYDESCFDDLVTFEIPSHIPSQDLRDLLEEHGFDSSTLNQYSGYSEVRYRGNIYGKEMLAAIRNLQEALLSKAVNPNWYIEVELDELRE